LATSLSNKCTNIPLEFGKKSVADAVEEFQIKEKQRIKETRFLYNLVSLNGAKMSKKHSLEG
jgi:hypothetical protein